MKTKSQIKVLIVLVCLGVITMPIVRIVIYLDSVM